MAESLNARMKRRLARHWNNVHIWRMARQVARRAPAPQGAPVLFFKASTGYDDLSWNAAFHLLTSWALRLEGIPVHFFACRAGMSHCVLGTNREDVHRPPPCRSCIYQSETLYTGAPVRWVEWEEDAAITESTRTLSLDSLMSFEWEGIPLGSLCLPALRWILRRHHLEDNEETRYLLREYIRSGWNIARRFEALLDELNPRAVIVFNGQFYPEAVARFVARRRGIRVITHEVGLQPASAFFTEGEATAYPLEIPEDFELDERQNARLDTYLQKRFQGKFTMAGIRFWEDMRGLDAAFLQRAEKFRQIVPIFTNVIFDTSQPHANTVFEDMFAWLDATLEVIRAHPETLFVIRAHPDEMRPRKSSRETVAAWVENRKVSDLPNVIFIPPTEYLSSYELIQRAKFVMIYNSTIGLEASILGAPVLCAGKARFTQYPTVFFPQSVPEYLRQLEDFLNAEKISAPPEHQRNARRFLYYQLFYSSLPFGEFLRPGIRTTHARIKPFPVEHLSPSHSPTIATILEGILHHGNFLLKEKDL